MFSEEQRQKFKTFIESCIDNRLYELVNEFTHTKDYQDFTNEAHDIVVELQKTLSKESVLLVVKYGDLHSGIATLEYDFLYRQAVSDCWMLVNSCNNKEGGNQI